MTSLRTVELRSVPMPTCRICGQDADELLTVQVEGRKRRACEECAEQLQADAAILEESESVVQQMMGFQGRR